MQKSWKTTLSLFRNLSIFIGVTERSIERNIQKLQKEGKLKRIGIAKGGHWQVA